MADRQSDDRAAKAKECIDRFQKAAAERGNYDNLCEEVARRLFPQHIGTFSSQGMHGPQGQKNTRDVVDATGIVALQKFAAFCESTITPRNSRWHYLVNADKTLRRNRAVMAWMDDVTETLFKYRNAPEANFASQMHQNWQSLGAYGSGANYVDALDRRYGRGLRYKNLHIGGLYFLENHQGMVDTVIRRIQPMSVRQVMQMFDRPDDTLPDEIVRKAKDGKLDDKVDVLHCVYPRSDREYDPQRLDLAGMRWVSCHVLLKERWLVRESGYNTFPFPISRYSQAPGEVNGRGPAIFCLPSLKLLNEQKKTVIKQAHRAVDPVIFTHDDGVMDSISLKPGAINAGGVNDQGKALFATLPVGNLSLAKEMMQAEAFFVNDAFLVTLFQIFVDSPEKTATEVLELAKEKGMMLSPTMGRQETELLGPWIDREIDVLAMQGLLPEKPAMLADAEAEYEVIYDSPLSRLQKAERGAGFMRSVNTSAEFAKLTGDPSYLDVYDFDTAQYELATEVNGVPIRWMATPDRIAAKRRARAEQMQGQQMIEAAPAVASVLKTVQGADAAA